MSKRITASARIQVTLDIVCHDGVWGEECSIGQLQKQAAESALDQLRNLFSNNNIHNITVIGTHKVTGIITQEE